MIHIFQIVESGIDDDYLVDLMIDDKDEDEVKEKDIILFQNDSDPVTLAF